MKLPRILSIVFLTVLLLFSPAFGQRRTHRTGRVHRPIHAKGKHVPAGATAQCRDGSYSFSQNHRGTCSHHGGVARWLR
jgi:hypothetical protein